MVEGQEEGRGRPSCLRWSARRTFGLGRQRRGEPGAIMVLPSPWSGFWVIWVMRRIWNRELSYQQLNRPQWIWSRKVITEVPQDGGIRAPGKYHTEFRNCCRVSIRCGVRCSELWSDQTCETVLSDKALSWIKMWILAQVSDVYVNYGVVNSAKIQCTMSQCWY